jgi:hypothetical protein
VIPVVATAVLHALVSSVVALFVAAAIIHGRTRKTQKNPQQKERRKPIFFDKKI